VTLDASPQHVLGLDLHFEVPEWLYVARTGSACVEVGGSLESLTEAITHTWEPGSEDVVIWLHARGACRMVAFVRDDQGSPCITFL
jgi:hypothetical protein